MRRLTVGLVFFLLSAQTFGLGLGNMRVSSALDEPLVAEIELTSVQDKDLETLEVSLGSREDFGLAGVERPEYLKYLEFTVDRRTDGRPVVRVTSKLPAKEPYLHFVVALSWAGGKLVREYTALLDPPLYAVERPAIVTSPRVVATPQAPGPSEAAQAMPQPAPSAGAAEIRYGEYGPTQPGDTLWDIASRLDVGDSGVNIFQVMMALLRDNPDAFFENNVNRLKVGQILRLENIDTISQIDAKEASLAYQTQLEEWQAYRVKLAEASGIAKIPGELAEAAPAPAGAAPEQPVPSAEKEPTEDVLRIVRATLDEEKGAAQAPQPADTAARAEVSKLREQISTLEETLLSRDMENKELRERVALLESQVENARRLVEIENRDLALAQQQAQQAQQAEAEPAQAVAAKPAEQPAEETVAATPPAKPRVTEPKPKPAPAAKPASPAKRAETGSWWQGFTDTLSGNWTSLLMVVGGVLVLLFGGVMYMRRRRSIAEFEESILSGSALEAHTETTDTGASKTETDTSFLSDFGMAGMGTMQADEVDPLAEAEVYLAYGRDEQAEEVLKEAVARDPSRHEVKLKLLEIYQQRNDLKSFETLAEEMYPAGAHGVDADVWRRVVEMGRKMNPDNPLFTQEIPKVSGVAQESAEQAHEPAPHEIEEEEQEEVREEEAAAYAEPSLEPFPTPDTDSALDEELDRLARDREEGYGEEVSSATAGGGRAAETLNFATRNTSELDFELDLAEDEQEQIGADESTAERGGGDLDIGKLDFDLDDEQVTKSATKPAEKKPAAGAAAKGADMDFAVDFDSDLSGDESWSARNKPAAGDVGGAEALDFEAAESGNGEDAAAEDEGGNGQWDEAATKLDLARAYIDMGDKAGARSILDEVIREGNAKQRDKAAELAAQLN